MSPATEEMGGGWSGRSRSQRAALGGLGASLAIHVLLLLIAAWLTLTIRAGGETKGPGEDAGVEFAMLTELELAGGEAADVELSAPTPEASAEATAVELPEGLDPSLEVTTLTGESADAALKLGAGQLSTTAGQGLAGGAVGGGTSFFGVEASGRRIAYIIDRSGSMMGEKITRAQRELVESVSKLQVTADFVVLAFSNSVVPVPADGEARWRQASADSKRRFALSVTRDLTPEGGTFPLPAFEVALGKLDPVPDVIYFMTDAEAFEGELPAQIERLNRRHKVPIHCIMFGQYENAQQRDAVKRVLDRIARSSNGSSTFRPVGG